jgi:hypothetical protein
VCAVIATAVVMGCSVARADDSAPTGDDAILEPGKNDDPRLFEAQARFKLGIQLYSKGDPNGALAELRRAYALVPRHRILFNLGEVAYQCNDYAAAAGYLSRYLAEGGAQIPEARRREVTRDLGELRARVGYLSIEHPEPGSRVTVDELEVGTTPLVTPVAANAGKRRIEIVSRSGERQTRTVDVEPGLTATVSFSALVRRIRRTPRAAPPPPAPNRAELAMPSPPAAPTSPAPVAKAPDLAPRASTEPPSGRELLALDHSSAAHDRSDRMAPWVTWTLAAVAAGGAAVTGGLAWSASRALREQAGIYPTSASDLGAIHDRERSYALASDGFLAGAVVLSALAVYFTVRGTPGSHEGRPGQLEARADW